MTHRDTIGSQIGSRWTEWGSDHDLSLIFPRKGSCYVYVAWGADRSRPLYIGKARNPYARIATHMRDKPWILDVVEWECRGFPSERQAERAEIEAIHDLNPVHNVMRRLTRAEWTAVTREMARKNREDQKRRDVIAAAMQARRDRPKPIKALPPPPIYEPVAAPSKPLREDVFTADQLEIIARVQRAGRASVGGTDG